jgi:transposase InsO family protein
VKSLAAVGITRSMSRADKRYDNAAMESSWSTPKTETGLDTATPASRMHAELAVFD